MAGKPNLKKKLDVVFSLFIRLRDARKDGTFKCISCGQIKSFDQADCGHYINRQHMSTRYSAIDLTKETFKDTGEGFLKNMVSPQLYYLNQ